MSVLYKTNKYGIPYLSFCGYSNSGKTTLLTRIIPLLKEAGLRTAVLKHDAHNFEMDHPGTDTSKFSESGADIVAISSSTQFACLEKRQTELPVFGLLDRIQDVDLILIEGWKAESLPKVLITRSGIKVPAEIPESLILAAVTDTPDLFISSKYPVFTFTQLQDITNFILKYARITISVHNE